jgi:hypothetical protein
MTVKPRGRLPKFCSHSCRQRTYEQIKWSRPHLVELLAKDLAVANIRDAIRSEALNLFDQVLIPAALTTDRCPFAGSD